MDMSNNDEQKSNNQKNANSDINNKKQDHQQIEEQQVLENELKKSDFNILGFIGQGSYGKVYVVERKNQIYAMKEIEKELVLKYDKIKHVFRE